MTGDTPVSREELVARSVAAGLNTMTSVSGQTSVFVTGDPVAGPAKLKRAADEGAPLVDEPAYLRLLGGVQPARPRAPHGSITATCGIAAAPTARATLDAATTERTMILAEVYRRGEGWRLRAVGQGYDHGLAELARGYGVDIAE
ncbi:TerD family protein [Streptomyces sp. NPDC017529]|uniref:TerD family protein n=1 Tax=Streptomyces sp. NPDC017529 TaxID=3365000 RepID=UPI0037BDB41E